MQEVDCWEKVGGSKGVEKFLASIEAHKAEMGITDPLDIEPCEFSSPQRPHSIKKWPDGSQCDGYGTVFAPDGRTVYSRPCPCWLKSKQRNYADDYISVIPIEFRKVVRHADMTKYACGKAFSAWHPNKSPGLYLCGNSGVGKTVAAHRAALMMINHYGLGAYYISCRNVASDCSILATDTSERYRAEERLTRHILACRGRSIVVLDDLGRERQSDATVSKMAEYIDALYDRRAPVVITTNLGGTEINTRYGRDITSRLIDTTWVTPVIVQGEDLRSPRNAPKQEIHFQTEDELFKNDERGLE